MISVLDHNQSQNEADGIASSVYHKLDMKDLDYPLLDETVGLQAHRVFKHNPYKTRDKTQLLVSTHSPPPPPPHTHMHMHTQYWSEMTAPTTTPVSTQALLYNHMAPHAPGTWKFRPCRMQTMESNHAASSGRPAELPSWSDRQHDLREMQRGHWSKQGQVSLLVNKVLRQSQDVVLIYETSYSMAKLLESQLKYSTMCTTNSREWYRIHFFSNGIIHCSKIITDPIRVAVTPTGDRN